MKKLVSAILILAVTALHAVQPVTDAELPKWVPSDKQIRADMIAVFTDQRELVEILRDRYKVINATVSGGWITVTVKRGTLVSAVILGKFDNIQNLTIKDGKLHVSYATKRPYGWFEFGTGTVVGAAIMCVIFGLAR